MCHKRAAAHTPTSPLTRALCDFITSALIMLVASQHALAEAAAPGPTDPAPFPEEVGTRCLLLEVEMISGDMGCKDAPPGGIAPPPTPPPPLRGGKRR